MLPATRDIWQGHPSTQAWKIDQQAPDLITELHHTAWAGDIDKLKVCLAISCCLAVCSASVMSDRISKSQVQVLTAQGSNVAVRDREGRSPLHYAAAGRHTGKLLLHITRTSIVLFLHLQSADTRQLLCPYTVKDRSWNAAL